MGKLTNSWTLRASTSGEYVPVNISLDSMNAAFLNLSQFDLSAVWRTIVQLKAARPLVVEPLYLILVGSYEIKKLLTSITSRAEDVDGIVVNMLKIIGDV